MPPKKQSVVDLPVVGVIDLNDEAPIKQKKPKKVKEVMEAVVEMPVVEAVVDTGADVLEVGAEIVGGVFELAGDLLGSLFD